MDGILLTLAINADPSIETTFALQHPTRQSHSLPMMLAMPSIACWATDWSQMAPVHTMSPGSVFSNELGSPNHPCSKTYLSCLKITTLASAAEPNLLVGQKDRIDR